MGSLGSWPVISESDHQRFGGGLEGRGEGVRERRWDGEVVGARMGVSGISSVGAGDLVGGEGGGVGVFLGEMVVI